MNSNRASHPSRVLLPQMLAAATVLLCPVAALATPATHLPVLSMLRILDNTGHWGLHSTQVTDI